MRHKNPSVLLHFTMLKQIVSENALVFHLQYCAKMKEFCAWPTGMKNISMAFDRKFCLAKQQKYLIFGPVPGSIGDTAMGRPSTCNGSTVKGARISRARPCSYPLGACPELNHQEELSCCKRCPHEKYRRTYSRAIFLER
jgi:hypothetical protein